MIILGSGITSFILKTFFPSALVISENNNLSLPLLFHIHTNEHIDRWMEYISNKYGIHANKKTIKVGYMENFDIIYQLDDRHVNTYRVKSGKFGTERIMNGLKTEYEAYEFDDENVNKIKEFLDVAVVDSILYVSNDYVQVSLDGYVKILKDEIVSTLPLPVLLDKMQAPHNFNLKSYHKAYRKVSENVLKYLRDLNEYKFIYDLSEKTKTLRYVQINGEWYEEFALKTDEECKCDIILSNKLILNSAKLKDIYGIELYGRYAQWDNDVLTHKVIERLMR